MLINQQFLRARLSTRYGVTVDCGVYDDGSKFKRRDGVLIPQADIDAETPNAEADEAAAIAAAAAEEQRDSDLDGHADTDPLISRLRTATPTQIGAYIDNSVTDLATAKDALKRVAIAIAWLAKNK